MASCSMVPYPLTGGLRSVPNSADSTGPFGRRVSVFTALSIVLPQSVPAPTEVARKADAR